MQIPVRPPALGPLGIRTEVKLLCPRVILFGIVRRTAVRFPSATEPSTPRPLVRTWVYFSTFLSVRFLSCSNHPRRVKGGTCLTGVWVCISLVISSFEHLS